MHGFMTTGTIAFLEKLEQDHSDKTFQLMKSGSKVLLYYEDTKRKSIFVSGKSGEILFASNDFASQGFVVMNHIPVTEGEMAAAEANIKKRLNKVSEHPNVKAARLLKENKAARYVIITQWTNEQDYDNWNNLSKDMGNDFNQMAKLPAYFADRPFTHTYTMIEEDDQME